MNALEIICEGYMEQEHTDSEEVRVASEILEDRLTELLPIETAEQILMDALILSSESMKQGFMDGFKMAMRMMRDC